MGKYGNVVQAFDGQDALEKFETEKFNILVTDISMPRMDGFALIKQIKEKYPEAPCIVTTALFYIKVLVSPLFTMNSLSDRPNASKAPFISSSP